MRRLLARDCAPAAPYRAPWAHAPRRLTGPAILALRDDQIEELAAKHGTIAVFRAISAKTLAPAPVKKPTASAFAPGDARVYVEELLPPVGMSKVLEKTFPSPIPIVGSCVTSGSHETTIAAGELLIAKHITYCKLPVSKGAGYDTTLVPLKKVSKYSLVHTDVVSRPRAACPLRILCI